ncbi:MAG: 50S ribosomal protein L3 [Betaproteobacteria bacterium]
MSIGMIGRKIGMTRLFTESGDSVPVTVVDVSNNRVSQLKTVETDGYAAVQVAYGQRRRSRINKATAGHLAKAGVESARGFHEFNVVNAELELGQAIDVEVFESTEFVDVSGVTKGKGFAGAIKRHNFSSQRASHGQSITHNAHGSTGMNQDPGRVFKGKKMAGHLGSVKRTIQNIAVVKIDKERNLMFLKGAVPGSDGSDVVVVPSVKKGA